MGASSGHHVLTQKGWYCFVKNKTKLFSVKTNLLKHGKSKHLEYSTGSPTFWSEKCVEPLNSTNIFNVHAFLHGICN